jgi:hypothetical protein
MTDEQFSKLMRRLTDSNTAAQERHQQLRRTLIFLPLIWGAISAVIYAVIVLVIFLSPASSASGSECTTA